MNYCDRASISAKFNGSQQPDDISEILYAYICPPLVIGCLISVFLNICLLIIGHFKIHNKSPILLLSLNLASTDTIASLLVGIGFVMNSYLPKVYNIIIPPCPMLAFEIFRISALIASVSHLFALAFIHYRGIAKPLHYRGFTLFCTNHITHSINFITMVSWIVPLFTFTLYFSTIECQGFLSPTCDYSFLAFKRYRLFLLTTFSIPLLLMFMLYIRIFMIISKNQKKRSQLTSHMSIHEPKRLKLNEQKQSTNDNKIISNDRYANRSEDEMSNEMNIRSSDNKLLMDSLSTKSSERPMTNQIPKINLEQKLTIKRSFYSKFNFLSRTLSSKSYTFKHQKQTKESSKETKQLMNQLKPPKQEKPTKLELNTLKNNNDLIEKGNEPNGKIINNNYELNNYNLLNETNQLIAKELDKKFDKELNERKINQTHDQINKKDKLNRLIKCCEDELIIESGNREEDRKNFRIDEISENDREGEVRRLNIKQKSLIKNEKQSVDRDELKTRNQVDYSDSVSLEQTDKQTRIESKNLLLNKFKCNYCFDLSCTSCRSSSLSRSSVDNEHACNDKAKRNGDHNLNNNKTNFESQKNDFNHLQDCRQIDFHSGSEERNSIEESKNSIQLNDGSEELKNSRLQINDEQTTKWEQINDEQKNFNKNDSEELIKNLSANKSNLIENKLTIASTNRTANHQEISIENGLEQLQRTPDRLSLNLVKKNSTCSSKSTKSFRSIKSVEIREDFLAADLKNQKDRLENSCLTTDSPIKNQPVNARSHFNYPRKLRNKINASIHGSRSARFHTKALFTTLTILGTYLICWAPALIWLGLTCVDDCTYPLFSIPLKKRVVISVVTNSLVIIKAITDPFIYIYRVQEVKLAIRQCSIYRIFFMNARNDSNRHQIRQTKPMSTSFNTVQRTRSLLISKDLNCSREQTSMANTIVDSNNSNATLDT